MFSDYHAYIDSKRRMFDEANPVCTDSSDDSDDTRLDEFKDSSGRIDWEAVYDSGICDDDAGNVDCDVIDDLYELVECDDSIACDDDVPF